MGLHNPRYINIPHSIREVHFRSDYLQEKYNKFKTKRREEIEKKIKEWEVYKRENLDWHCIIS